MSTRGVRVEKTLEREENAVRLRFTIQPNTDDPMLVRLVDPLPSAASTDDVLIPVEQTLNDWTIDDERLVCETIVFPGDALATAYAIHTDAGGIEEDEVVLRRPAVEPIELGDWKWGGGEADDEVIAWLSDRQADEADEDADAMAANGQVSPGGTLGTAFDTVFEEDADAPGVADAVPDDGPPTEVARDRLSTGIEALDRRLNGGVPTGDVVALMAPPDTQSERLVRELIAQRDTLYVSTVRPAWEVEEQLEDAGIDPASITVEYPPPKTLLKEPMEYVDGLGERTNLVIDSIDRLEVVEEGSYLEFLNVLKRELDATESAGLLCGIDGGDPPPLRNLTLKRADLVWRLRTRINSGRIENQLVATKFRGGTALTEPVKLLLADDVDVDTSRDIA